MRDYSIYILTAGVAVTAPIHPILISAGILIFVDLFTGIIAALKRKEKITSAGLRRTVSKILAYNAAVISAFLLEKFMLHDVVPVVKLVAAVIGIVEVKSIFENCNTILEMNIFDEVLKRLGSKNDSAPKE